ncbi:cytochrome C oxidase Cbb3 [Flavobacterium sp. WLB]|uniref:FixH family protein n=1 Tax=unclassified Flavobacterium TaxID=196869 RepID=UPI0006ABACB8|nr:MULTISPECIES: FixH family protein [unclassified Flavobacterium]KOP36574.1 cytochrome C oxidase Cbb3 [Flavobacterium sp. VMW]OWU92007.1 cytochrome C oxidase Cbb3 [Flavobacterium sp. NLM]PUU69490.1 cytochrome C oxidase Cbb3 [Flavobacterium sp. WLB]
MKINWGTGIVIAFALFMTFILYFVFEVQSNSKYDNDLVVEEYYKHDTHFQEEMARIQNAHDLQHKPSVKFEEDGVKVTFPATFESDKIKGNILLYRPSNKKFDFNTEIVLTNSSLLIPHKKLIKGRWDVNMEWQYEGKKYLTKEVIYVK